MLTHLAPQCLAQAPPVRLAVDSKAQLKQQYMMHHMLELLAVKCHPHDSNAHANLRRELVDLGLLDPARNFRDDEFKDLFRCAAQPLALPSHSDAHGPSSTRMTWDRTGCEVMTDVYAKAKADCRVETEAIVVQAHLRPQPQPHPECCLNSASAPASASHLSKASSLQGWGWG